MFIFYYFISFSLFYFILFYEIKWTEFLFWGWTTSLYTANHNEDVLSASNID